MEPHPPEHNQVFDHGKSDLLGVFNWSVWQGFHSVVAFDQASWEVCFE